MEPVSFYKEENSSFFTKIKEYYNPKNNISLNLVSMCHIGTKEYFSRISEVLKAEDIVLYENICPYGLDWNDKFSIPYLFLKEIQKNIPTKDELPADLVSSSKELNPQGKDNRWINADVTWSDIINKLQWSPKENIKLGLALFGIKNATSLKRSEFGKKVLDKIYSMELIDDEAFTRQRNQKVQAKLLYYELKNPGAKISILYGASHMSELEKMLLERGYQPKDEGTWLMAYSKKV